MGLSRSGAGNKKPPAVNERSARRCPGGRDALRNDLQLHAPMLARRPGLRKASRDPVRFRWPRSLAIVATIVERRGGRIDVFSGLGRGTAFTVALPGGLTPALSAAGTTRAAGRRRGSS